VFSENITVKHVLNVKSLAWGVRDWTPSSGGDGAAASSAGAGTFTNAQVDEIVRRVMAELKAGK
jgi:hypothetical protein